jgi:hypothetical protein
MIWITVAAIVALALVAVAALHTVGQMLRAHARERNLMLNQLLHLAGRTWQPPPAAPEQELEELLEHRYESAPGSGLDSLFGDE